jgi:gluconate kinase
MSAHVKSYTAESVLTSLGYEDALTAARQQVQMLLLGRKAHYEASIQQIQARWEHPMEELRSQYEALNVESFEADDDYLQWRWYQDALETVEAQLQAVREW